MKAICAKLKCHKLKVGSKSLLLAIFAPNYVISKDLPCSNSFVLVMPGPPFQSSNSVLLFGFMVFLAKMYSNK